MDFIYITTYQHNETDHFMDVESFIVLNIYQISDSEKVILKIKPLEVCPTNYVRVDLTGVKFEIVQSVPEVSEYCSWPVITQESYIIAGLCSVSREIIKQSAHKKINKLLGFRGSCLTACSESSIWTKFCEVDMVSTVKNVLVNPKNYLNGDVFILPQDMCRFEYHMAQPVRMHNVYKVAREQNNDLVQSNVPINQLNIQHTFSEGPFMTLSDIILFSCFKIFFMLYAKENFEDNLPLTLAWYNEVKCRNFNKIQLCLDSLDTGINKIVEPDFIKQSLYTADPVRYKPEKRIYTKQKDIINSLRIINNNHIEIVNSLYPYGDEIGFDWSKIPSYANPISGAVPASRAYRKCHQLENLAKAVIKVVKEKDCRIVDFCSGSGHLGILLAFLLPHCTTILVENKEMSLLRAKETVSKMNLKNVIFLQSNLDYFVGSFDVGVSLHACGVATDLVMQHCVKNKAHFVCCPCCYGGIHDCYHLTYPRSVQYQNLKMEYKDYLTLAHAADQTHDHNNRKTTQGFICMDAIDTDRKLYAESCGYEVHLGKLHPVSCTNKNNLLVGICKP